MVDADLYKPLRNGQRDEPLGRLARYAELGRHLDLGIAGDIVEPPCPRRVIEPAAALLLPNDHLRSSPQPMFLKLAARRRYVNEYEQLFAFREFARMPDKRRTVGGSPAER